MTKTQQTLIAKAKSLGGAYSVEAGSGRGAKGGRVAYGARELAALWALEALGLVTITGRDSGDVWMGNGNTVRSTVVSFKLAA